MSRKLTEPYIIPVGTEVDPCTACDAIPIVAQIEVTSRGVFGNGKATYGIGLCRKCWGEMFDRFGLKGHLR